MLSEERLKSEQSTDQTATDNVSPNEEVTVSDDHWSKALPEDLAGHGDVKGSKSLQDFVGRYIEHRGALSRSIMLPNPEAGEEELDKFYEKLTKVPHVARLPQPEDKEGWGDLYRKMGVPEKPEGYEIEDEKLAEKLHGLNLNKTQAARVKELFDTSITGQKESRDAEYAKGQASLQDEWGDAYEQRMIAATKVIKDFGGDDIFKFLAESGEGNNPAMAKMMYGIAKVMHGKKMPRGDNTSAQYGLDKAELQARIESIRNNKSDAYHNASHPDHDARVATVEKMYEDLLK